MPDEDKKFGGFLVLDFKKWWHHVQEKNTRHTITYWLTHAVMTIDSVEIECEWWSWLEILPWYLVYLKQTLHAFPKTTYQTFCCVVSLSIFSSCTVF